MIKRVLILPDVHLTGEGYSPSYSLAKTFVKDIRPDEIILLGDFLDCTSLSHWIENKTLLLENKRYLLEIGNANEELDYLQKYSKKVTYLEGNHENWVQQYIEKHPMLEGMLEIPLRLELKERNIEWFPLNELYRVGKMYFLHGDTTVKYHASKMLQDYGCCLCYGHTHTAQTAQMNMKMQEPIMAYGLGCLCSHEPHYMKGKHARWIDQVGIMEYDENGNFNLTPINITAGQFIWEGKEYK